MTTAFTTYAPIAIAVLALVVSGLSFWVSRMNYRRAVLAELPTATAELTTIGKPGWYRVMITVTNRSGVGQRWTDVEIRKPRGGLLIEEDDKLRRKNPERSWEISYVTPLPVESGKVRLPINVALKPFGEDATIVLNLKMSEGDAHSRPLLLFVPPSSRAKRISIRVNLHSREPVERHSLIDVRRTLPQ
jgi:hypothetical protein